MVAAGRRVMEALRRGPIEERVKCVRGNESGGKWGK